MRLEIDQIHGTTSAAKPGIYGKDNILAYIASGGALVCEIDRTSIVKRRFFCANQTEAHRNEADDYLKRFEAMNLADQPSKDVFGFPKDNSPEVILRADPSNQCANSPSKLRNKMRNVVCLAISPDKHLFAMGEIGYRPRILIYSLAPNSSAGPIYIIEEHTFGVSHLCFSPDSSKLCSLGSANDGFLYVWDLRLGQRNRLLGSAKCITTMNDLLWHENHVIALGQRSIKLWKFDKETFIEGRTASLKSRNAIMKQYVNSIFKEGRVLDCNRLLALTEANDLFLLNLQGDLVLQYISTAPFALCSVLVEGENLLLIGDKLGNTSLDSCLQSPDACFERCVPSSFETSMVTANLLADSVAALTACKQIYSLDKNLLNSPRLMTGISGDVARIKKTFSGKMLLLSQSGYIQEVIGDSIEPITWFESLLPQNSEQLFSCFDFSEEEAFLGDNQGALVMCNIRGDGTLSTRKRIKLHTSSILDVIFFEKGDMHFLVTIGRDRMVQVLQKTNTGAWNILQTIGIHKGALIRVIVMQGKIYVCSADRSISVHTLEVSEGNAVLSLEKMISLKSTPITFDISQKYMIVTTTNKEVLVHQNDSSFPLVSTFRIKTDQQDAVSVDHLVILDDKLIAACGDKSIQVWSITKCQLLATGWGHAESIVGVEVIGEDAIYSLGYDGCLFKWKMKDHPVMTERVVSESVMVEQPVRKFTPSQMRIISPIKNGRANLDTSPSKMKERITPLKQRTSLFNDTRASPNSSPLSHRTVMRKSSELTGRTKLTSGKFSCDNLIQQLQLLQKAQDITAKEKETLLLEMRKAAHHLDEDLIDHKQVELLSHYSDQLVKMVERRLQSDIQKEGRV